MKIFVDISHSFIREPIKLAIANTMGDSVSFVKSEDTADLTIGISDIVYKTPCIILTDDPHVLVSQDKALAISAFPSNKDEMTTLVSRVIDIEKILVCQQ